jgi:group I intron endonuclease
MITGIYTITCLIDNKILVGSGNLHRRKITHFNHLRKNKHNNPHLQFSFNKHGEENFIFEIIEECSQELCLQLERYWIVMLGTKDKKLGYNINDPVSLRLGIPVSKETRNKLSVAGKKRIFSKEHRERMSLWQKNKPKSRISVNKQIISLKKYNSLNKDKILERIKKVSKPVLQYDLKGNFIREFPSINSAAKFNNIYHDAISDVVNSQCKTGGGYKWKFK